MREKLKPMYYWTLEFLGNAALRFAAFCANLRNGNLDVAEKSEAQDSLTPLEPVEEQKEVVAKESKKQPVHNFLDMADLPLDIYLGEYFTMPTELRRYPDLVKSYRKELVMVIQNKFGYDPMYAEYVLQSMEYYLALLKAGTSPESFRGQLDWIQMYTKMSGVIANQDKTPITERAYLVRRFIDNLEEKDNGLKSKGELLATMQETGVLPTNVPIAMLDMLSFVSLPTYFKGRIERINVSFNSSMKIRGEFNIN